MSGYRIELRPAAARALTQLDPVARRRVQGAIALLAQNPRPPAAIALRVGDYRVIYTVEDSILLVLVITIGHRRDAYRQ